MDERRTTPTPHSELRGRRGECARLDHLLQRARASQSGALVIRGEAGVGKTALLEYLVASASDCRIARATGVESEMELAFAALHQLCAPMLDRLDHLPTPQGDALRTAFGLRAGEAPDRFLVGLAVLGLLSDVSEEQPLVCVVDDAQWLDRVSAQVLAFVARRLLAESVALVFGMRDSDDSDAFAGLPEQVVGGLSDGDARALLDAAIPGRLDERIRDRIVTETRGNPLALLELPRGLTPAELAGGFGLPKTTAMASTIEASFVRRMRSLPVASQQLLLAAAAEPVGDVDLLWRAAARLGIPADAAAPAAASGLIEFVPGARFRHPLVRSAVYRAAGLLDRQAVHQALADATDEVADPDRRAWHRAHAALGPDEEVASALERSADRARGRGGVAAAAAFLERATVLTPDAVRRGGRALAAAHAKFEAAAPATADELLKLAETCPLDAAQRARVARLRAEIVFARKRGSDAPSLLLEAVRLLEPFDAELARETHLEALSAAIFAGRLRESVGVYEIARAARHLSSAAGATRSIDFLLNALATRFTEGYNASAPALTRVLMAFSGENGCAEDDIRWLWLACRVAPDLWDDEAWHRLAARHVQLANDAGALSVLPLAMTYRAGVHVHAGEFAAAEELINQADAIADAAGIATLRYTSLVLAAWRGGEADALRQIHASIADATARGEGRAVALALYATAVLYNGVGFYERAFAAAEDACAYDDLGLLGWALIELIEAAVRSGNGRAAAAALRALEGRTRAVGTHWARGVEARSRALLSDGSAAESLYVEAIEELESSRIAVHLARAELVYGEWLRRAHRRVDARHHLRVAYDMFAAMGADAFGERTRRELMATGETVRKRTVPSGDVLTAQEAQVALLVADGATNGEIGAQLFISPRTVEYHLRKVFTKLGISSRREIRKVLRDNEPSLR